MIFRINFVPIDPKKENAETEGLIFRSRNVFLYAGRFETQHIRSQFFHDELSERLCPSETSCTWKWARKSNRNDRNVFCDFFTRCLRTQRQTTMIKPERNEKNVDDDRDDHYQKRRDVESDEERQIFSVNFCAYRNDERRRNQRPKTKKPTGNEKRVEISIIQRSDTIVHWKQEENFPFGEEKRKSFRKPTPRTMMIEILDANVTNSTMSSAWHSEHSTRFAIRKWNVFVLYFHGETFRRCAEIISSPEKKTHFRIWFRHFSTHESTWIWFSFSVTRISSAFGRGTTPGSWSAANK